MVYKVVEFQGTPRIKFSEEIGKVTLPGPKSVLRVYKEDKPIFDLICGSLEAEALLTKHKTDSSIQIQYFLKKAINAECKIIVA